MKKGINIPHLFKEVDLKKKMLLIKQAGFDILMPTLDFNHEVIMYPIEDIVEYAKQIDLQLEYGHAPYKEPQIKEFWCNNETGQEIENTYYKTIDIASKYGIKIIICHLHFGTNYELNEVGLNRLTRLANYAKQKNVIIAVENLYSYNEPEYIFSNINHPNLKMCYDSGHENFLTPNANFLNKFSSKIIALHLHDNNGITDEHKTIFTSCVNWEYIIKGVSKLNSVPLTLEVKPSPITNTARLQEKELKQILKKEFESLIKLESLIYNQKQKFYKLNNYKF